ncbi:squalene synthase HpnC [Microvirga alba]|uniref:Squalene synthase HpnC n=1 Tax=Microvirga alba TaxID=2791025 RepID=A0A931BSQ4_9HYPH|nr:squalene synthase HpnC [Microvirga alba]MBF9235303.1 squalene synthase HpnC [Microvirga alba]
MIRVSGVCSGKSHPGKLHREENFPVASRLIHPRNRGPILAFYRFVRAADDIADDPNLARDKKLRLLDSLERGLTGSRPASPEAEPLRISLAERGLSPRHALDLIEAFRIDVCKTRYRDWSELMGYCTLSAMPVGRFVLDVHGEARDTWPASDALCAALQIIDHLQDCAKDYRTLDRVYLPVNALSAFGVGVEALGAPRASPELRACLTDLGHRTALLVQDSANLTTLVADARLSLEVAAIRRLALTLLDRLKRRDPLSESVHLGKAGFALTAAAGVAQGLFARAVAGNPARLLRDGR